MAYPRLFSLSLLGMLAALSVTFGEQASGGKAGHEEPSKIVGKNNTPKGAEITPLPAPTLLSPDSRPIDLASALQLGGVQNPEILLARERVVEAVALRQLAAAQLLPTLNAGTNFDNH